MIIDVILNRMIKNFCYILSFLIIFVNDLSASSKDIKIIAKIDNQIITNIYLNNRYKTTIYLSNIKVKSKLQKAIILDKILEQLIDEKLQSLDIKKNDITIDPKKLEEKINQIIINNGFDLKKLSRDMKRKNISYDEYRDQIKIKILFNILIKQNLYPKIKVTNSAINEILEINNIKNNITSLKIAEIYISPSNNSWKIAQTLFSELKTGANFTKLSREFSDLYDYISGEEIGWIKEGELHPKLYQAISNLNKNQISNPVELNGGYYIFKILNKKEIPNTNIDNLEQIENSIFKRELAISIRSYMSNLRKNSNIIIF